MWPRLPLADAAVEPPVALLGGQVRMPRLGDGALKDIPDAGVLPLAGLAAQTVIELAPIGACKLQDGLNAERDEIPFNGRSNAGEISQPPGVLRW